MKKLLLISIVLLTALLLYASLPEQVVLTIKVGISASDRAKARGLLEYWYDGPITNLTETLQLKANAAGQQRRFVAFHISQLMYDGVLTQTKIDNAITSLGLDDPNSFTGHLSNDWDIETRAEGWTNVLVEN